jgi:hypothetical protein
MRFLDRLERKFGRYAVPNATVFLIAGQTIFYVFLLSGKVDRGLAILTADLLREGELWRLVTFLFNPPLTSPIFAFFAWYLFYFMGTALEEHWGNFRYNAYLLTGFLTTVAVSFLVPAYPVSNAYIGASVFLAFAFLYPDFVLRLFFILPVRIKWLALLTWAGFGYTLLVGQWHTRLMVLASLCTFLLFFGRDLRRTRGARRAWRPPVSSRGVTEPFHRCTVCGITDQSHPAVDFRYCPQCDGQYGYCQEHIFNHRHIKKGEAA